MRSGLFETMRCYNGKVFALGRHLDRLVRSCPVLGMKAPSRKALEKAVKAAIAKDRLIDAALKLEVFKSGKRNRIAVFKRRFSPPTAAGYKKGFSIVLFRDEKIAPSVVNSVKSLDRHFYQRLAERARKAGFDEAIFLNAGNEVAEGSRTNIFLVKGRMVTTPRLASGCLPGVTRAIVLRLLKKLKVVVEERRISPEELLGQDEIFLTNSLIEVMPATRLDKKVVGTGKPGRLTQKIMDMYKKEVEKECGLVYNV